jgi:hypothetical protein
MVVVLESTQQTPDNRQQTSDNRQQTADSRQQTRDLSQCRLLLLHHQRLLLEGHLKRGAGGGESKNYGVRE